MKVPAIVKRILIPDGKAFLIEDTDKVGLF